MGTFISLPQTRQTYSLKASASFQGLEFSCHITHVMLSFRSQLKSHLHGEVNHFLIFKNVVIYDPFHITRHEAS